MIPHKVDVTILWHGTLIFQYIGNCLCMEQYWARYFCMLFKRQRVTTVY